MSDSAARRGADESSAIGRSAEQTDSPQPPLLWPRRVSYCCGRHAWRRGSGRAPQAAPAARQRPASRLRPLPRPRRALHGARRGVRRAAARGARRRRRRAGACVAPARRRALRSPSAAAHAHCTRRLLPPPPARTPPRAHARTHGADVAHAARPVRPCVDRRCWTSSKTTRSAMLRACCRSASSSPSSPSSGCAAPPPPLTTRALPASSGAQRRRGSGLRALGGCACGSTLRAALTHASLQADLHFRAAGTENWAPLLLFVGFLGVVVIAARLHFFAHFTLACAALAHTRCAS
jgi:hypothetical protein